MWIRLRSDGMQHTHVGLLLQRELSDEGSGLLQTIFPIVCIGDTSYDLVSTTGSVHWS
jgi:hypothetical protein